MRNLIVMAALACAFAFHAAKAAEENLGGFLAGCQAQEARCLSEIASDIDAGGQMGEVCFPAAGNFQDGAKQALDWLRKNAAANPRFAQFSRDDALQMSFGRLWPCTDH